MAHVSPWRLVASTRFPDNEGLGELVDARTRRLHFELTRPCTLSLTISGRSPALEFLTELSTDLLAYRLDDDGDPVLMFRGVINQTEDEISETADTVTMTATDYRGALDRFQLRAPMGFAQVDQGAIFRDLVASANAPPGTTFRLGVSSALVGPDGTPALSTGILRDRSYPRGQVIGSALDDMSTDINGFEWSVEASETLAGVATLWYPARGLERAEWVAHYGATVSKLARTVNTSALANYALAVGDTDEETQAQYFSEAFAGAWLDPVANPEGVWMATVSAPSVTIQSTLDEKARGYVEAFGSVEPSYAVGLTPGRWSPADAWLGDTVRLIVRRGRLNVDRPIRITAVDVALSDEGDEAVSLTLGQPAITWGSIFRSTDRRLASLETR